MTTYVLMVLPNEHVQANKKLKLQASSIQELCAQVALAVKLGEDAVLCAPTTGVPSASDQFTSLAELGEKAKVMVWPVRAVLGPREGATSVGATGSLTLVCPEDCEAGDTVAVEIDGVEIEVEIPEGVEPGDEFDIHMPDELDTHTTSSPADEAGETDAKAEAAPESAAAAPAEREADPATSASGTGRAERVLLVLPNEHVVSSKKLKLQASSIQELCAQVALAVKLGEDAVLCAPTTGVPSASDQFTSLAELGEKAKVMVWPVRAVPAHTDQAEVVANPRTEDAEEPPEDPIKAMRTRMSRAVELETNPDRLTELILASLDFGEALEAERMAVQSRFEAILETQERERVLSRELEIMEQEQVTKTKGLRRLSIAAAAPRRLSMAVGAGKKEDLDAMAAAAAAAAEFEALSAAADTHFSISEAAVAELCDETGEDNDGHGGDGDLLSNGGSPPKGLRSIAAFAPRRLSLAVGGGKKEELGAVAAAAEVDSDSGAISPSSRFGSRTRSTPSGDTGPLDRACMSGSFDKAVRFARESPQLLVKPNRQGMLPLHEVLRHDAPIDIVRALVELMPETLLMPNNCGRTAEQMVSNSSMGNVQLLHYLREAKDAYVNSKRTELEPARRDEARSVILMVMPNHYVSAVKQLRLEAADFSELTRLVGESINLHGNVAICEATDNGSVGEQYNSFTDLGELANVMVWPSSLLASVDTPEKHLVPNEDLAGVFAAAASIVSSRAADEQSTRMIAAEEHKIFSDLMAKGLALDTKLTTTADTFTAESAAASAIEITRTPIARAETERDDARHELEALRTDISALRSRLAHAASVADEKDQEIASLRQQISDQRTAAHHTKKTISDLRAANTALQNQLTLLEEKLSAAVEEPRVAMLEQEKAAAELKVKDLTDELGTQREQVSKQLVQAAVEAEALATELVKVREKFTDVVSEQRGAVACAHATTERGMGPSFTDDRQLGVTPSLRRQLRSVAAVQKLAQDNDSILSIAAELAFWPAVRNAEAQRDAETQLIVDCMGSDTTTSKPPEGVPYENGRSHMSLC